MSVSDAVVKGVFFVLASPQRYRAYGTSEGTKDKKKTIHTAHGAKWVNVQKLPARDEPKSFAIFLWLTR